MIKIATISSTRADFGLLKNLIKKQKKNNFKTRLIATGTHFSKQYGYTYSDILNNKIKIDKKINKKIDTSNPIGISKIMSAHIFESSKIFTSEYFLKFSLIRSNITTVSFIEYPTIVKTAAIIDKFISKPNNENNPKVTITS